MSNFAVHPSLSSLVGPFTKIARAMSRNHNVKVIPTGHRCSTNGTTIYIPFNADKLTPELRERLHGMLDHEVSHVSEEGVHRDAGKKTPIALVGEEPNKTIKALFNVFEDVRIENKYSAIYPGVAENLNALNQHTIGEFLKKGGPGGNAWHVIGCGVIAKARGLSVDWMPAELGPFFARAQKYIDRCPEMVWGEDALALATEMYEDLKEQAEESKKDGDEQEDDDQKDTESEKGEESDGEKGEGESSEGNPEEGDEASGEEGSEGESADGEAGDEEGAEGGEEQEGDASDGEETERDGEAISGSAAEKILEECDVEDLLDDVKDELEKLTREESHEGRHYVPSPWSLERDYFTTPEVTEMNHAYYLEMKREVSQQVSALRAKQTALLQTVTRSKVRHAKRAGRLDRHALTRARMGSDQVFSEHHNAESLDTAIQVLVDCSGSMGSNTGRSDPRRNDCAYYAVRTALALLQSWESIGRGVASSCIGYHSHSSLGCFSGDVDTVRRPPFQFINGKDWNETLSKVGGRFASFRGYENNVDGEAVMMSARRLALRPEKRKILVVICDGIPNCYPIPQHILDAHLREVIREISAFGIEVVGIGAGFEGVTDFYNGATNSRSIVIKDVKEMAPKCISIFRELLAPKKKVAA